MALKPLHPGPRATPEELEGYERSVQDAKDHPQHWANGPEHVPERLTKRTTVEETVTRPPRDAPDEQPVTVDNAKLFKSKR